MKKLHNTSAVTFALFFFLLLKLEMDCAAQEPELASSAILNLESTQERLASQLEEFKKLSKTISERSPAWLEADRLAREAAAKGGGDQEANLRAIEARKTVFEQKFSELESLRKVGSALEATHDDFQREVNARIADQKKALSTLINSRDQDLQELRDALRITEKVAEVLQTSDRVFELFKNETLSSDELLLIQEFSVEIESLQDQISLQDYSAETESNLLNKLNALKLQRNLELLSVKKSMARASIVRKGLSRLVRADGQAIEAIKIDDMIAQSQRSPITEIDFGLSELIPKRNSTTSRTEVIVDEANAMEDIAKETTLPKADSIKLYLQLREKGK